MMTIGYMIPLLTSILAKLAMGEKNFTCLLNKHLV